ncbi:MAG: HAD family hydrolase [Clostridia bacterium]|nr:HAD family hydrolase [Clostridia bacterium]
MKDKLLIFDMDNTLLQSRIDFSRMHQEVGALLRERGLSRYIQSSVAQSILDFTRSPDYDPGLEEAIWARVAEIEAAGLERAALEPGALAALAELQDFAELVVLTNNADAAIGANLMRLGLAPYLSLALGRDSVPCLKPAPEGIILIRDQYPAIPLAATLMIGDAMIDAQAAAAAGIGFIAYNRSREEDWQSFGIQPLLQLRQWDEQACAAIRRLMQ